MHCQGIFFCNDPGAVDYVYGTAGLAKLRTLAQLQLRDGVFDASMLERENFSGVDVIFSTWGMPDLSEEQWERHFPSLKAVFYAAGATDAFARPLLRRGVTLCSAWQANAIPVAEFVVAQILLAAKGYFRLSRNTCSPESWETHENGKGCFGETVALLGAGAIARQVTKLLKNFQLTVIMVPSHPEHREISLEEAFRQAYIVSNHLPDRPDNRGILGRNLFASMRRNATFINTGRGAQVDETGLTEVLAARPDLTALLDVTRPEPPEANSKLYRLPNVHLSPHIAGSIGDEVHRMAKYMLEEFERFSSGLPLKYAVSSEMLMTSQGQPPR